MIANEESAKDTALSMSFLEFILLISGLTALIAMAVDTMLPALNLIGSDLNAAEGDDVRFIISFFFLGMGVSQIVYGPLSDAFGRKVVVNFGLLLFVVGCVLSVTVDNFTGMIVARVLQGLGIAAPRVVSMAIVRDLFVGRAMARVMSFSMSIFILVPVIAPALGQFILDLASWRAIFTSTGVFAVALFVWFNVRLQETLPKEKRQPLSWRSLGAALKFVCTTRNIVIYTAIASGLFGVFLAYLSSAQHIFQVIYDTGRRFPLYFALLSISMGVASVLSGLVVMRLGMRYLCIHSMQAMTVLSVVFLIFVAFSGVQPPLWSFMLYLALISFNVALLFGNINALAMEPLGEYAGMGAGIIGSISNLLAIPLGIAISQFIDTSIVPLTVAFLVFAVCGLLLMRLDTKLTGESL